MLQVGLFVGLIVIGMSGLVVSAARERGTSSLTHLERMRALDAKRLAAQEELIAALTRKSDAFENLANEREKSLALYRKVIAPTVPNGPVGIPAEQLGGGNGN